MAFFFGTCTGFDLLTGEGAQKTDECQGFFLVSRRIEDDLQAANGKLRTLIKPNHAQTRLTMTRPRRRGSGRFAVLLMGVAVGPLLAANAQSGGVTRVDTVAAPSLRANLIGDPDRRAATVYLPPSYSASPNRRYPVIYLLHGFAADHRAFVRGAYQNFNIRISMDSLIRAGAVREMIVVTPSARNAYDGSFYANSPVTGNWEDFIVRDLVRHMDRNYRTVRRATGRGLAGHSMGGYGALRIGMRNPRTFSAVYSMSACCLAWSPGAADSSQWRKALSADDRVKFARAGFHANLLVALAAVNSPNSRKPPLFVDLPYRLDADSVVPDEDVALRWRAGPLAMVAAYARNLRGMSVAFDAGRADGFRDIPLNATELHRLLGELRVPHEFELYEGTHGSRIRARLEQQVLPFFSRHLTGAQANPLAPNPRRGAGDPSIPPARGVPRI